MICSSSASLHPEVIMDFLKREAALKDLYQRVLSQQIISEAAERKGITVTEEEIQAEADRQRHQKHLESSKATFSWLAEQLMTPEDWEAGISDRLLAVKLNSSTKSKNMRLASMRQPIFMIWTSNVACAVATRETCIAGAFSQILPLFFWGLILVR
jgi:hypothetical protein